MDEYCIELVLTGDITGYLPFGKIDVVGVLKFLENFLVFTTVYIKFESFELDHENRWKL
jgi:hypothetical protein